MVTLYTIKNKAFKTRSTISPFLFLHKKSYSFKMQSYHFKDMYAREAKNFLLDTGFDFKVSESDFISTIKDLPRMPISLLLVEAYLYTIKSISVPSSEMISKRIETVQDEQAKKRIKYGYAEKNINDWIKARVKDLKTSLNVTPSSEDFLRISLIQDELKSDRFVDHYVAYRDFYLDLYQLASTQTKSALAEMKKRVALLSEGLIVEDEVSTDEVFPELK